MSKRRALPSRTRRFDPRTLEQDLRRQRANRGEKINEIITRYARLQKNGKPVRCRPSRYDVATDDPTLLHSWRKVVFDTEEAALACAVELREELGDDGPRHVYECRRSRHGHVHLTTKPVVNERRGEEVTLEPRHNNH